MMVVLNCILFVMFACAVNYLEKNTNIDKGVILEFGFQVMFIWVPGISAWWVVLSICNPHLEEYLSKHFMKVTTIRVEEFSLEFLINNKNIHKYSVWTALGAMVPGIVFSIKILEHISLGAHGEGKILKLISSSIILINAVLFLMLVKLPLKSFEEKIKQRLRFQNFNRIFPSKNDLSITVSEIVSLYQQLNIPFSTDYFLPIRKYVETSPPQEVFADTTELNSRITIALSQAKDDLAKLHEAIEALEHAEQSYLCYNDDVSSSLSLGEIKSLHDILTSNTLKSLLSQRQWKNFHDIVKFITIQFHTLCQQASASSERPHKPESLKRLQAKFASEFERTQCYHSAAILYFRLNEPLKAFSMYQRAENHSLSLQHDKDICEAALRQFYFQHRLTLLAPDKQRVFYDEYFVAHPDDLLARMACAKLYVKEHEWAQAVTQLQAILGSQIPVLQAKALLLRAQCFLGRAEGADIMLGFQDIEQALTQYRDALTADELTGIASGLHQAQYLQMTGTQNRLSTEHQRILGLLLAEIEYHYARMFNVQEILPEALFEQSEQFTRRFPELAATILKSLITAYRQREQIQADDAQEMFSLAVQLWLHGHQTLAYELLDTIGTQYQHLIETSQEQVPQIMESASDYWAKAQENPDIPLYDRLAERLWQAIISALEPNLPLEAISKERLDEYYWLFKAYQAVREPVKCEAVGLKILGLMGFQGYKDVRQIVEKLMAGEFQRQQWQSTGGGTDRGASLVQPDFPENRTEQFGEYSATYYTKGGMGEIYKGMSPTGQVVAIKRIPRYALHGTRLERFIREIQVVREISHPHIVKVLAVNQEEGYYVMEWAEQGTLEYALKESQTLPLKYALDLTWQIADALEAVHQREIIHRDIKPSNILLFANETAKLTDFGVAHAERAETLTGTGVQVGTLRYMSPEQYLAEEVDAKTDIFSLGLMLYEMLTGDIPFSNPRELCQCDIENILSERQPHSLPNLAVPLIIQCLRNNANRRYTAKELKDALQQVRNKL